MKTDKFPKGWDEQRTRRVLEHYESQTEDGAVDEDQAVQGQETVLVEFKEASKAGERMNPIWSQGPRELLEHAYGHLKKGEGFDCRIAFVSVDNAVEVMAKAFLSFSEKEQG